MQERRKNVRVRPAADYNILVDYEVGLVKVQLQILDAAVGGMGLVVDQLFVDVKAGTHLRFGVTLPDKPRFETSGRLAYTQGRVGGRCGVHFSELTEEQQLALSRAISELLERGHSA